jgi:hypothetical protein
VAEDAGRRFVRFTRGAGERIGRAVVGFERQTKGTAPLTFEHQTPSVAPSAVIRKSTFTGAWAKDSYKTLVLTINGVTSTVSVENFLYTLPDEGSKKISIAKDGGDWFLVNVAHVQQDLVYDVVQTSTELRFDRMQVWVPAKVTTSPVIIGLAECVTGYTG